MKAHVRGNSVMIKGREVTIDCGDNADIQMIELWFPTDEIAWKWYCKNIEIECTVHGDDSEISLRGNVDSLEKP